MGKSVALLRGVGGKTAMRMPALRAVVGTARNANTIAKLVEMTAD